MKRVAKTIIDKNAPGMDSPAHYTKLKPSMNKEKHISPKKADRRSKQIQSGRAAKGKTKLLPRISMSAVKSKKYPSGKIEKKESNIK